MRANDIDLARMLLFQPESGKVLLGGRRMLILSQQSLGVMAELLASHLGQDYVRPLFAQFGYRCGHDDYAAIVTQGDWETDMDRLRSGPIAHMWEGLVHVAETKIDYDRSTGHFRMTGIWRNSYEAENYRAAWGVSQDPVCASLTGYASGWGTAFFGRPLLAIETMCEGRGDPHCAFEIRPAEAWGPEADPWRHALEANQSSIGRILEQRIESRTRDLRASEARYRAVVEAQTEFIVRWRPDGTRTFVNEAYARYFGQPVDELVGSSFFPLIKDDDERTALRNRIAALTPASPAATDHHRARRADGQWRWQEWTDRAIFDGDGRMVELQSVGRDIHDRVVAEQQLRDKETRFRALVDHATDSFFLVDGRATICDVNDHTCNMLGYTREELIGKTVIDIDADFDPSQVEANLQQLRAGETVTVESRHRRKDGSLVHVEVRTRPFWQDGEMFAVCLTHDVTERRRVEDAMRAAKEAADEASRAKSEFLATMSHEIRTPMNGVMGFANFLLETPLTDEQRSFVETIRSSGNALLSLINDILDVSKVEAGQMTLEDVRYDLTLLLDQVIQLMTAKAGADINLSLECAPDVPGVLYGDPGRVRQVLLNLVGNAVKFTLQGSIRVTAKVLTGGSVKFAVTDTGIGIDAAALPKLFERFAQADASTTRRFGGTGLGLAICKRLVELMGGTIGVDSEPGVGSTFWFTLPTTRPAGATAAPELASQPAHGVMEAQDERVSDLVPVKVLLAEDNAVNQFVAVRMLKALGCAVDVASSGREAVDMWSRQPYDVIFMDCHMPDTDGFEATMEIRQREQVLASDASGRRVRIVACTASIMREEREACKAAGMDDFVAKPLIKDELARTLSAFRSASPSASSR